MVAIYPHGTIAVVAMKGTPGGVDRNQVVVDAEPVALGIAVGEQASLQHLVRREADAGHDVGWVEGRLLDLGKVVFRVAVQFEDAHLDKGVILMEPDLGEVEGVVGAGSRFFLRHHLNEHGPPWEVSLFNAPEQIALMAFPVLTYEGLGFLVGQILDALLRLQVKLDPVSLVLSVDEAERVAAKAVHVPVGTRNAPVAHDDGDLVQCLGQGSPEVPVVAGAAQVGTGVALDSVVEVGELEGIAQEEDGRVVAHQVPVSLLGIELDGKAADIALGIRRASLAGHGGETGEEIGLLSHFGEDLCLGVAGDVMGDCKGTVGPGSLGVHAPLGDDLPVEVSEFFQEPDILQ